MVQGLILLGTFNLSSAALIESWDISLFKTEIQLCAAPPLNAEVPKCRQGSLLIPKMEFLDALASLKTMFKIKRLMFSRLQDFKSITEY